MCMAVILGQVERPGDLAGQSKEAHTMIVGEGGDNWLVCLGKGFTGVVAGREGERGETTGKVSFLNVNVR